jgi:hypothetical protein
LGKRYSNRAKVSYVDDSHVVYGSWMLSLSLTKVYCGTSVVGLQNIVTMFQGPLFTQEAVILGGSGTAKSLYSLRDGTLVSYNNMCAIFVSTTHIITSKGGPPVCVQISDCS